MCGYNTYNIRIVFVFCQLSPTSPVAIRPPVPAVAPNASFYANNHLTRSFPRASSLAVSFSPRPRRRRVVSTPIHTDNFSQKPRA